MAEPSRYAGRYAPASGRRSPVLYNPARASLPVGVNYAPYAADPFGAEPFGGEFHVTPISHHDSIMSGRAAGDYRANSIPVTTTTYAVRKDRDPTISRSATVREAGTSGRTHRSSTIDTASKRPPIIITTKHAAPTTSGSHAMSNTRSDSPTRDPYRSSEEGQYYAQPETSINRSRSTNRTPYTAGSMDPDDFARLRERTGDERLRVGGDAYRAPRQPALYPYEPRHPSSTIDYGNEGYEYTKPSDLARYDLDTARPPRSGRRDSFDRYSRPSVSVSTDIGRPFEQSARIPARGPPPSTRGFDKVNRVAAGGIYDAPTIRMPVPPVAPVAPDPARRSAHLGVPGSPTSERRGSSRTRPVSLYQDSYGYMDPDDLGRGHHDPYAQRHPRHSGDYFQDDVTTRGFGIRLPTDAKAVEDPRRDGDTRHRDERRDRRDSRLDDRVELPRDPRRRSDEDLEPLRKRDRDDRKEYADLDHSSKKDDRRAYEAGDTRRRSDDEWEFVPRKEERKQQKGSLSPPGIKVIEEDADPKIRPGDAVRDRKDAKDKESGRADDDRESKKDKVKDKVVAGLGIAAASIGIGSVLKDKDGKQDKEDRSAVRRSRDSDDLRSWESAGDDTRPSDRHRPSRREGDERRTRDEPELVEPPRDRDPDRPRKERPTTEGPAETRDRNRRETEAALTGEPVREKPSRDTSTSSTEDKTNRPRRKRFNPNDAAALAALKAELAATEAKDRQNALPAPTIREPSPEREVRRSPSPSDEMALVPTAKDDRGRDLIVPAPDERQVRVVSPPRDKDERKPIKGILKQPTTKFAEEPNPIREGVAPHKDDKTKANVPSGARWTKINRALVNPEALTIGKERFEVRDDFVIVLRVLSKEEIQAYATATAQLREMRKLEYERGQKEIEYEPQRGEDEEDRRSRHRHHRRERDEEYDDDRRDRDRDRVARDADRDRDRDGRRRHRHRDERDPYEDFEAEGGQKAIEYHGEGGHGRHGHHRSHRVGE